MFLFNFTLHFILLTLYHIASLISSLSHRDIVSKTEKDKRNNKEIKNLK